MSAKFKPMKLIPAPGTGSQTGGPSITCTCTIKGEIAKQFEAMQDEYGLNRAQLVRRMVYHCLGRTEELKDFYKRLAILGG